MFRRTSGQLVVVRENPHIEVQPTDSVRPLERRSPERRARELACALNRLEARK